MRKKILYVSPYFSPELISSGKYNTKLVEELKASGDVDVWCMHPFYPEWEIQKSYQPGDGYRVKRAGGWVQFPQKALLRRFVLELAFALITLKMLLLNRKRYDIVVSVLPPSLFSVLLVLWFKKTRNVAIVHDLQSVYIAQKKGIVASVVKQGVHVVENFCMKRYDKIVFLSKSMCAEALETYDIESSACFVGYPFITLFDVEESNNLSDILPPRVFNVVYSGALGEKQNPSELIRLFVAVLDKYEDIKVSVFSMGPVFEKLRGEYRDKLQGRLDFYPLVPEADLRELYSRSDLQLVPQTMGSSSGSLPSKIPNILYCGVPVLVVTDEGSELMNIIEEANAGIAASSWDSDELVERFEECMHKINSGDINRDKISAYAVTHFSVSQVASLITSN